MALNVRNKEAEEILRDLVNLTGETKTRAVTIALKERLDREQRKRSSDIVLEEIKEIANHYSSLPVLDDGTDDEILGYDENGLPT